MKHIRLRLFNKYAHFYHHFISSFLQFHSLLCKPLRLTEDFTFGAGYQTRWIHFVCILSNLDLMSGVRVHFEATGNKIYQNGLFFLFNTILLTKQKNMIYELFKSNHCECICVFNCTITLMAVNLFLMTVHPGNMVGLK